MPFTLSHPAAVLPFRRLAGGRLVFPALVVGSLTPDAGYFVNQMDVANYAHTPVGILAACVPIGLLLYAIFMMLRGPTVALLPNPHRDALAPYCRNPWPSIGMIVLSLILGAWTHVAWDSFTHKGYWMVTNIPLLQAHIVSIGSYHLYVYRLLQHLSSLTGLFFMGLFYFRWLRRTSADCKLVVKGEGKRYLLWLGVLTAPALLVLYTNISNGRELSQIFLPGRIFESVVLYVAVFFALIALLGIAKWLHNNPR